MNWINQLGKSKTIIIGGILLIAFSALIVTCFRSPVAYDPFWHLQMGKDWLENGLSPWFDHYSFTYNGQKITNPPFIFQGLLYLATSHFGLVTGFQVLRFGSFVLILGASFLLLRQIKAPAIIYAIIIPMIVFLLELRALVRPELFSYTLSIVALMLYIRAGNSISARNLIPMVVLIWFWSIYHSSVIGYVILFGFFLDCAMAQFETRAPAAVWRKWFAWGTLIVAVGFLNPGFSHPLIEALTFPSEWKILIREYFPPASGYKSIAGIYVIILIALLTPVFAYKQRRFGFIVIWAVLTYSAVTMTRMVTPSGIVVVMLAARLLVDSQVPKPHNRVDSKFSSSIVWLTLVVSIGVILFSSVKLARYYMKEYQVSFWRYPTAMANYMSERQMSGRIFNDYDMGGYLIYRLAPQVQVYIDGRTQILYPLKHMKRYKELMSTSDPEVLRVELDKYAIDKILWKRTQSRYDLVQKVGGFGLDFMDANYVLYTREAPNFPLFGMLLSQPECWRPSMTDGLNIERQKMDDILPAYSGLFPFADLVVGYSNAIDGKAFFDATIDGEKWFDEMRRFAGYRFLETGEYDLVAYLLGGVEIHKPKDYLVPALAKIKGGDIELASRILEDYSNVKWPNLMPEEVFIEHKLYQLIARQRALTSVEQQKVDTLKATLVELEYRNLDSDFVLDAGSLCASPEN